MKHPRTLSMSIISAAVLGLAACGGGGDGTPPGTGAFRVVNGIQDSQPLDVTVSNVTTDIQNIAYGTNSGISFIPIGSYKTQITTSPAGGGASVTYTVDNVPFDQNSQTTLYAIGALATETNSGLIVERSIISVASTQADIQFVNASLIAALTGTIYLVAPGTATSAAIYSTSLQSVAGTGNPPVNSAQAYSVPAQINQGIYEIIVTVAGIPIYDSGSVGVTFAGGSSHQIALLDATAAQIASNISTLQLLSMDNQSGSATVLLAGAQ